MPVRLNRCTDGGTTTTSHIANGTRAAQSFIVITVCEQANSMPRGPKGEKRPADVIGNAAHVEAGRRSTSLQALQC
jgi:hypothetical protein